MASTKGEKTGEVTKVSNGSNGVKTPSFWNQRLLAGRPFIACVSDTGSEESSYFCGQRNAKKRKKSAEYLVVRRERDRR